MQILGSLIDTAMDWRLFAGTVLAFTYNEIVGRVPSRNCRHAFLNYYLGSMGVGTAVQMHCRFLNARKVHLGQRNIINFGCLLDGRKYEIRTGHDVAIGPEATILTLGHDPHSPGFVDKGGHVIIGNHVWIAYRALILPGVNIGDGAVVGAGAVVASDVDPYTIVGGVPARPIGVRTKELTYKSNYSPWLS